MQRKRSSRSSGEPPRSGADKCPVIPQNLPTRTKAVRARTDRAIIRQRERRVLQLLGGQQRSGMARRLRRASPKTGERRSLRVAKLLTDAGHRPATVTSGTSRSTRISEGHVGRLIQSCEMRTGRHACACARCWGRSCARKRALNSSSRRRACGRRSTRRPTSCGGSWPRRRRCRTCGRSPRNFGIRASGPPSGYPVRMSDRSM